MRLENHHKFPVGEKFSGAADQCFKLFRMMGIIVNINERFALYVIFKPTPHPPVILKRWYDSLISQTEFSTGRNRCQRIFHIMPATYIELYVFHFTFLST